MKESPLIQVFKNVRISLEDMFTLGHRTFKHSPAQLTQTFRKLQNQMKAAHTHEPVAGRKSTYSVPDVMEDGLMKLMAMRGGSSSADKENDEGDVGVSDEVNGEDGDLNVGE